MKKIYETPNAEKISFEYQEQVVASNVKVCIEKWTNVAPIGIGSCTEGTPEFVGTIN